MLPLICLWLAAPQAADAAPPPPLLVAALHIDHGAGDIRIRAQRRPGVQLQQVVRQGGDACLAHLRRDGATVHIEASTQPACRVDLDLRVAADTAVRIRALDGRINISGLRAALQLTLRRGGAVVGGQMPQLQAELGAGSLSATGLFGSVSLRLVEGNAQIWFTAPPQQSFVTLDVAHGNVVVAAPDTAITSTATLEAGTLRGGGEPGGAGRLQVGGLIARGDLILRASR